MEFWRRRLPLAIVFIIGMTMIFQFYIPHKASQDVLTNVTAWIRIIAAFTLVIGVFSLMRAHFTKIKNRSAGWAYSVVMFLCLVPMTVFGLVWGTKSGKPFMWVFDHITVPLSSTIFSLLAFYIVSAAYRSFRARTFEATIMLVAALIIMIGRTPFGDMISVNLPDFFKFSTMTYNIFNFPVVAAKRAIFIGIALSVVATSLRIIFGVERTYMGGE